MPLRGGTDDPGLERRAAGPRPARSPANGAPPAGSNGAGVPLHSGCGVGHACPRRRARTPS
eukprot:5327321-Lingulodinium_polyedra.AAC.1